MSGRNDFWNVLRKLGHAHDLPWVVYGDFNEILYACEKVGGVPREEGRMKAFREVVVDSQLLDLRYSSPRFTWERGNLLTNNIREILDRGLAFKCWAELFPNAIVQHLLHSLFDHCPRLLCTTQVLNRPRNRQFRFEAW